jgi:hypothetical protein
VDLGLDHPHLAAEFLGRLGRPRRRKRQALPRGTGDAEFPQDLLALVFMDFHAVSLLVDAEEGAEPRTVGRGVCSEMP